jgi:hypothetical protein
MKRGVYIVLFVLMTSFLHAQIHTVQLFPSGSPTSLPIIHLKELNSLELHFDDFDTKYKNYYYTIELLQIDGKPADYSSSEYLRGFPSNKITKFEASSVTIQPYYHYQVNFPNADCAPKLSGVYNIKVYEEAVPEKAVVQKTFYVTDDVVAVFGTIEEPFDFNYTKTHQKVQFQVDAKNVPFFQERQVQCLVFQNQQLANGVWLQQPSFVRGNVLTYNNDQEAIFPAGKEFRWLDMQHLRFKTDRIERFESHVNGTEVFVKPDVPRGNLPYFTFNDLNGQFIISNTEQLIPNSQNDYALVHFTFMPPNRLPYVGYKLYLMGALTENKKSDASVMTFNAKEGVYQKDILLKQGYYSYQYILEDLEVPNRLEWTKETEGDHVEAKNQYTIFVFYTFPGARHASLVGLADLF